MTITIPYYDDMSRISNSNIGWFLNKGPTFLHNMLIGKEKGETGAQLDKGTMIHMYLLQPDEFTENYKVGNFEKPKSTQQENFCESLANTVEIEPDKALLSAYKQSYSIVGKSDEKMLLEAKEIASKLKSYIESKNQNIKYISEWSMQELQRIGKNVDNHKLASKLVNPEKQKGIEIHHEFHINWECEEVPCKSLLDSVVFDHNQKKVTLMDIKTTAKLYQFEKSIDTYDYFRQMCFYSLALRWYIEHELNENPDDWDFECYIIAIDTIYNNAVRVFRIEEEDILSRTSTILHALRDIRWHLDTNMWDHSKEYYVGSGAEVLKQLTLNAN